MDQPTKAWVLHWGWHYCCTACKREYPYQGPVVLGTCVYWDSMRVRRVRNVVLLPDNVCGCACGNGLRTSILRK